MNNPNNAIQVKNVVIITPEIAAYIKLFTDVMNHALPPAIQKLSDEQFAAMAKMGILPAGYGNIQTAVDAIAEDEVWCDWPTVDTLYLVEQFQGTIQTVPGSNVVTTMNQVITTPELIAYIDFELSTMSYIETEFKSVFADKQHFNILPDTFDFRQHIVNINGTRKPAGVYHDGKWFPY